MRDNWNWNTDYSRAWHATDDPRLIAVIERDTEPSVPYGDALCPAYYIEYNGHRYEANSAGEVYRDGESDDFASRWCEARERFREAAGYTYNGLSGHMIAKSDAMLERWALIFHDTRFDTENTYPNDGSILLLLDTPTYRHHVGRDTSENGATIHKTWSTDELFKGEREEWRAFFDGEVYGIGYGVCMARVDDETPVEECDFEDNIECWGFYGDDYAKESALRFDAGQPDLPTMLDLVSA